MHAIRRPLPLALLIGTGAFALFCLVATRVPAPDPYVFPVFSDPSVALWAHIAINNAVILTVIWGLWRYLDWREPTRRAQVVFGVACLVMLTAWVIRAGISEALIGGQNAGFAAIFGSMAPHAIIELALFSAPAAFALVGRRSWGLRAHGLVIALVMAIAVVEVWISPLSGVLGAI